MNFLHINDDIIIDKTNIIGIFNDLDRNKNFLEENKKKFLLRNITDKNKSFLLIKRKKNYLIYFSKINSKTLIKRFL